MPGTFDPIHGRSAKRRTLLLEQLDHASHRVVVVVVQRLDPLARLVRELDLPWRRKNISQDFL